MNFFYKSDGDRLKLDITFAYFEQEILDLSLERVIFLVDFHLKLHEKSIRYSKNYNLETVANSSTGP